MGCRTTADDDNGNKFCGSDCRKCDGDGALAFMCTVHICVGRVALTTERDAGCRMMTSEDLRFHAARIKYK